MYSRARYERYESFATYPTGPVPRSWFFVRDRQPSPPPRSPILKGNKTGKWCRHTTRPSSSSVTRSSLNASILAEHSRVPSTGKRSRLLFHRSISTHLFPRHGFRKQHPSHGFRGWGNLLHQHSVHERSKQSSRRHRLFVVVVVK